MSTEGRLIIEGERQELIVVVRAPDKADVEADPKDVLNRRSSFSEYDLIGRLDG